MTPKLYVLDTSSIMELSKLPPDVLPGVWEVLIAVRKDDRLIAPRECFRELKKRSGKKSPIHEWASRMDLFIDIDVACGAVLTELDRTFPNWIDKDAMEPEADPIVVALAESRRRAGGCQPFVITEEDSKGPGSLKIPDVCARIELDCGRCWEILRQEGKRF